MFCFPNCTTVVVFHRVAESGKAILIGQVPQDGGAETITLAWLYSWLFLFDKQVRNVWFTLGFQTSTFVHWCCCLCWHSTRYRQVWEAFWSCGSGGSYHSTLSSVFSPGFRTWMNLKHCQSSHVVCHHQASFYLIPFLSDSQTLPSLYISGLQNCHGTYYYKCTSAFSVYVLATKPRRCIYADITPSYYLFSISQQIK